MLRPRTTAFGYYPHNMVGLAERVSDHLADPADLASRTAMAGPRKGSRDRYRRDRTTLVFRKRPARDHAGAAARSYAIRYGVKSGHTGGGVHGERRRLSRGVRSRSQELKSLRSPTCGRGRTAAAHRRVAMPASIISTARAWSARGKAPISAAQLASSTAAAASARRRATLRSVLMSGGFTPTVHLFSQSRGKLCFDETLQAYLPDRSVERERSAGACRGILGLSAALADGSSRAKRQHKQRAVAQARGALVLGIGGRTGFKTERSAPSQGRN